MSETPRFGEPIISKHASDDNPQKRGTFVRSVRRPHGAMNAGVSYEVTDGNGAFWEVPIGNAIRPMPDDRPVSPEPHRWNVVVEFVSTTSAEAEAMGEKFLGVLAESPGEYGEATVRLQGVSGA